MENTKEFNELYLYIEGFITSNIDSIYINTQSLDFIKYVILLRQIAKKRIETKKKTKVNWKTKEIEIKLKDLNDSQIRAMYWILRNDDYLIKRVEKLVNKFKNGKTIRTTKNTYV